MNKPHQQPESAPVAEPAGESAPPAPASVGPAGARPSADEERTSVAAAKPAKVTEVSARREPVGRRFRLKLLGIGGAGGNTVRQVAATRGENSKFLEGVDLFAVGTDFQGWSADGAVEQVQIGAALTHGLGAGGDPEIGARAAQQDSERLASAVGNCDVVFLTAGLGGGTGGGASPVVARLAREQGALVLAFVALPFGFEGERRRQQALAALEQLKAQADAVICVPNDKLFKLVGENAPATEAFKRCDGIIASGAQAVWQLLSRKGLINLDFADLRAMLGAKHCEGLFGCGAAEGPDKARNAVKALMENPLFDGGQALARAEGVLVSILGGPDLTLAEVQRAVEPISRLATRAHVIIGAAIEEESRGRIALTVIAATNILPRKVVAGAVPFKPVPAARTGEPNFCRHNKPVAAAKTEPAEAGASAPEPSVAAPKKEPAKPRQETLPLDNLSRGRFDKSEPTLYNGEDLDVPTFLRRGVSLKQ